MKSPAWMNISPGGICAGSRYLCLSCVSEMATIRIIFLGFGSPYICQLLYIISFIKIIRRIDSFQNRIRSNYIIFSLNH